MNQPPELALAPLGKKSTYVSMYQPDLLFVIPRKKHRDEIHVSTPLPFQGHDIWNAYELSWLNQKGKPIVAACEFIFPCESQYLIESKSFKLYLNSFNNTVFESFETVQHHLQKDLSHAVNATVSVNLYSLRAASQMIHLHLPGKLIDDLDVACHAYQIDPTVLITQHTHVTETVCSDLLKSNCLVTGQPDWGSVQITYTGQQIVHENLLQYLVSFRNHNEFHEQCVERIFMDVMRYCQPEQLLVYARYTRRGGLDINPYRANYSTQLKNIRLFRQ